MRIYNYFALGDDDGYGQPAISIEPKGTIKMSITITSQSVQDNINYEDCNYMGLTLAEVDDTYIIDKDGERLKVLYVNPMGRYKQVFMKAI